MLLVQEDYPPFCLLAALLAHRKRIPYILSFERYAYYGPTPAMNIMKAQDLSINRLVWRWARALTFHSKASASFLFSIGAVSKRMYYTPGPVNCSFFSPFSLERELSHPPNIQFLCVARLVKGKGLEVLLEATKLLANETNLSFSLRIRGRGPLASALQQRVQKLNLSSMVHLDQSTAPVTAFPTIYRAADIYVQPSLHEPFGMACREAMSVGLPVVVTRTGGLADVVQGEDTGVLVSPGNVRELASAMGLLLRDGDRRRKLGRASRQKATEEFDVGVIAERYERIILGQEVERYIIRTGYA